MNARKIRNILSHIFAEKENLSLENRLFLNALIVGMFLCVNGAIVSPFISPSYLTCIICILLTGIMLVVYYFIRYKRIIEPFKIPMIIASFIGISTIWLFDGGINGSDIMIGLVILMLTLIGVADKNKKYVLFLFLGLTFVIYLIQLLRPDLIINISLEKNRWIDSIVTVIYSSVCIFLIIRFVHKNYSRERERAEVNERIFKSLSENSQDYIARYDRQHRQIYLNSAWNKMSETGYAQLIGKTISESGLYTSEQCIAWERNIESVFQSKLPSIEQFSRNGINEMIYLDCRLIPEFNARQEVVSVLGVFRDITEIKQSELQLYQLNADKDRFISIIAHDLKSPFSSILGFLELLLKNSRQYDPEKIESQLQILSDSARQHYNLLEDLLVWTRSNSGKLPFEPKWLDLRVVSKEALELLVLNSSRKNISISFSIEQNTAVFADVNMVKTILRNLVSNAIKFTNPGGHIKIFSENEGSFVRLTVDDTGIGIVQDKVKSLFDFSVRNSTIGTDEESGIGLGLMLCKEFVEKHGCRIWVESQPGIGSQFNFTLPRHLNL